MAIVIDERARSAVSHRRAHGHDPRILVGIGRLHGRACAMAGNPEFLTVGWVPHRWQPHTLVARNAGAVTVIMESRVVRYAERHDPTISARRLGPIDYLSIDPPAVRALQEWERAQSAGVQKEPGSQVTLMRADGT